jgi:hypothetical protein
MIRTTASALIVGDVVLAGHGYGEAPAVVEHVGRFTSKSTGVKFGPDGRFLLFPNDYSLDRAPRDGEVTVADERCVIIDRATMDDMIMRARLADKMTGNA